ncbi:hypothetical protein SELMODRAFT_427070 [Selaginella moellendorffii]|uniref:Expansin-like EG45 domain-containing protein n=1 Tax=Selaginella moellendorffii TaxID=88036 RepID=D8SYF0_SELML|nr:hypothetical protein SELMODRAFT_427070 [Selaginella moellendorffii]
METRASEISEGYQRHLASVVDDADNSNIWVCNSCKCLLGEIKGAWTARPNIHDLHSDGVPIPAAVSSASQAEEALRLLNTVGDAANTMRRRGDASAEWAKFSKGFYKSRLDDEVHANMFKLWIHRSGSSSMTTTLKMVERRAPQLRDTSSKLRVQPRKHVRADDLEAVLREAFAHPAVEGVVLWGFWQDVVNEAGKRLWQTELSGSTDKEGKFHTKLQGLGREEWWKESGSELRSSACYGYGSLPSDYSFAAAAPSIYSNGAACGRYYCVKCTSNGCRNSNVIRLKIVDLCPGCPGAFDLSQQAFA